MKYISTRGSSEYMSFCDVLMMGLAPDGGLMVPIKYPKIPKDTLDQWRNLSYPELAFEIMSLYVDDIPSEDLKELINKTYTKEIFASEEITPLRKLKNGLMILALSNGPTLAFKDIAMQFLGNVFEYILTKKNRQLNIVGATSGDTGSAAEYAMRGKKGINVFMLSPHGKMSDFQRAQMYSLQDENIYNIALDGMFDDCQDIIKAIQADENYKEQYQIGTVNSINWGRILAQIVYYFKGYFAATNDNSEQVSFSVPSGNFGDACAGHIARMMGLPIERIYVATNENDVLDEFFSSGRYIPRPSDQVTITSSPSMDIAKASNLERFVFDVMDRDSSEIVVLWAQVNTGKGFDLKRELNTIHTQFGMFSGRSYHLKRIETIKAIYADNDGIIDPHTADGVAVALELKQPNEKVICLETALPVKFAETIYEALGKDVEITVAKEWEHIESIPQKYKVLPNNTVVVQSYIKEQLA